MKKDETALPVPPWVWFQSMEGALRNGDGVIYHKPGFNF